MITQELATEEILRFKILEKYPKTKQGEEALIQALIESAVTDHAAKRFVSYWIRTNKRCPMPCDVYQTLDAPGKVVGTLPSLPVKVKGQEPLPAEFKCNLCEDTGWHIITTNREIFDLPGQYYTAAKRCSHPPSYAGTKAR